MINETPSINDPVLQNDLDIVALWETWMNGDADDSDNIYISEAVPTGYEFHQL